MNKLAIAALAFGLALAIGAQAQADTFSPEFRHAALANGVDIEPDAIDALGRLFSDKIAALQAAIGMIALKGWCCDSISAATAHLLSTGFTVHCNGYRYSYDFEDRGGTWTVTLD